MSEGLGSRPQVRDGLLQRRSWFWLSVAKTGAISDSPPLRLMSACGGGLEAGCRRIFSRRTLLARHCRKAK